MKLGLVTKESAILAQSYVSQKTFVQNVLTIF